MLRNSCVLISALLALSAASQEDAHLIYDGNDLYHNGRFAESSAKYRRALDENPNNRKANFNLGNAMYREGLFVKKGEVSLPNVQPGSRDSIAGLIFDQAAQNYAVVANSVSDKDTLHRAWHNIGNCYLQKKDYKQAVDAYKKSLKFDPKDEETRYNLAYALKHMPKEQKGGGGGQDQQQQKQQQQQQQQKQQQQQAQQRMSRDQAEQLLKALMNQERRLQDRRKQKQDDPSRTTVEKDW